MGKPGTFQLEAWDAGYVMLVDEGEYKYLITVDGKKFNYFLNPAVYGSGATFVRWDSGAGSNSNGGFVSSDPLLANQFLDDRYGVGANYITDFYGRPPFGSALPNAFVKLDDSNELQPVNVDSLKLTKAYTSAVIIPYLIVKVYEERLASYEYYSYLSTNMLLDTDDSDSNNNGGVIAEDYLTLTTPDLIEKLATELKDSLAGGYLNDVYKNFAGLTMTAEYYPNDHNVIEVGNMAQIDGFEVRGERFGEITTGHLAKPDIIIPGLTRVVGNEVYGFKPMRGAYTIFAPEKLSFLMQVVNDTVDGLATSSVTDEQKAALKYALGYHWRDFFRGSDQALNVKLAAHEYTSVTADVQSNSGTTTITVPSTEGFRNAGTLYVNGVEIPYTEKTDTTFTVEALAADVLDGARIEQRYGEIRANVFFAALGSQWISPVVTIEDTAHPGSFIEVAGQGVNLTDTFSYDDEHFHRAKPYAQHYTTGPYGAQGIVNEDGTITWISDQYSV